LKSLSNPATARLPPAPVVDMVASTRGHEHHPYIGEGYSYQVWSLGHYGAYKQTSIGTSFDS